MYSELVEYVDGETVLEGCLITANAQDLSKPLVLVIHDWTGRGQYALDKAQEMAELGYAAFAIDMYASVERLDFEREKTLQLLEDEMYEKQQQSLREEPVIEHKYF